jgi:hypothetical protein
VAGAAADDDVDLRGHPGVEEVAGHARVEVVGAEGAEEAGVGWGCVGVVWGFVGGAAWGLGAEGRALDMHMRSSLHTPSPA